MMDTTTKKRKKIEIYKYQIFIRKLNLKCWYLPLWARTWVDSVCILCMLFGWKLSEKKTKKIYIINFYVCLLAKIQICCHWKMKRNASMRWPSERTCMRSAHPSLLFVSEYVFAQSKWNHLWQFSQTTHWSLFANNYYSNNRMGGERVTEEYERCRASKRMWCTQN